MTNIYKVEKYGIEIASKYEFSKHNVLWEIESNEIISIVGDTHNMSDESISSAINEFKLKLVK